MKRAGGASADLRICDGTKRAAISAPASIASALRCETGKRGAKTHRIGYPIRHPNRQCLVKNTAYDNYALDTAFVLIDAIPRKM
jgi:hypothetical protein